MSDIADKQRAGNRALVAVLTERGDALTQVRTIDHFAYFPSEQSAVAFTARVRNDGFAVNDTSPSATDDGRFAVYFSHEDLPQQEPMDKITIALAELAVQLGGDYDGWETPLIT